MTGAVQGQRARALMANAMGNVGRGFSREVTGEESHPIIAKLTCVALLLFTPVARPESFPGERR